MSTTTRSASSDTDTRPTSAAPRRPARRGSGRPAAERVEAAASRRARPRSGSPSPSPSRSIAAGVMVGGVFSGAVGPHLRRGRRPARHRPRRRSSAASGAPALADYVARSSAGSSPSALLMVVPSGLGDVSSSAAAGVRRGRASGDVAAPARRRSRRVAGDHRLAHGRRRLRAPRGSPSCSSARRSACSSRCRSPPSPASACPKAAQVGSGHRRAGPVRRRPRRCCPRPRPSATTTSRPPLAYELRRAAGRSRCIARHHRRAVLRCRRPTSCSRDRSSTRPQEPQKPKTVPLSEVEDRVLFEVESAHHRARGASAASTSTTARTGGCRPSPRTSSRTCPGPASSTPSSRRACEPRFTVAGLGGAVLPGLPEHRRHRRRGPEARLRRAQRQHPPVAGPGPGRAQLHGRRRRPADDRRPRRPSTEPPPAGVAAVHRDRRRRRRRSWRCSIGQGADAPTSGTQFDFLRTYVLDNVTADGRRAARERHARAGRRTCSPAARRARPSRSSPPRRCSRAGSAPVAHRLRLRRRRAGRRTRSRCARATAPTFVEVYFPGYKWLPVIGTPKQGQAHRSAATRASSSSTRQSCRATTSRCRSSCPSSTPPEQHPRPAAQRGGPGDRWCRSSCSPLLVYLFYPAVRKAIVRAPPPRAATAAGAAPGIALAYAEWRDYATDFGYRYPTDTPLMFLDRFVDDDEHTELAWLVTRALWGDLQDDADARDWRPSPRSCRAPCAGASAPRQPATVRVVAAFSRLSLRDPFAPDADLTRRVHSGKEPARAAVASAARRPSCRPRPAVERRRASARATPRCRSTDARSRLRFRGRSRRSANSAPATSIAGAELPTSPASTLRRLAAGSPPKPRPPQRDCPGRLPTARRSTSPAGGNISGRPTLPEHRLPVEAQRRHDYNVQQTSDPFAGFEQRIVRNYRARTSPTASTFETLQTRLLRRRRTPAMQSTFRVRTDGVACDHRRRRLRALQRPPTRCDPDGGLILTALHDDRQTSGR